MYLSNKRILVTGACGTVGSELVRQFLENDYNPAEVIALDNNESGLFFLEQRFQSNKCATSFFLADVRDRDKLCRKMVDVDVVFHLAALKHVILCERSPFESVQTNIYGVQNIIYAASENRVKKVIFTSSDKAVNPTSVMGTSKLMGERLMTAANSNTRNNKRPVFASTRFGNVLGSRGSVIPIFRKQIKNGGPVTVTHPEMTRFIMSISEAVRLIIDSVDLAQGGEVFITKMPVIRILDLAKVMIQELAPIWGYEPAEIKIECLGARPGEKMYEELMTSEETRRALELTDYFAVLPAFRYVYNNINYIYPNIVSDNVINPYASKDVSSLSHDAIAQFLKKNNLLTDDLNYE